MLASRRGLGPGDFELVDPVFADAVRWVLFVEKLAPDLVEARSTAATDPPTELTTTGGAALTNFISSRARARARVAELEPLLYPLDEEPSNG